MAGAGGTAGTGSGGNGGTGTAGNGGAAGSGTAGTGSAGTGSVVDGGVDSGTEPDSGIVDAGPTVEPDSGLNGNCPDFATATALTAAQNSQPIAIVRVTFNPGGTATLVLRGTDSADAGGFTTGDMQFICVGPDDADCVDPADTGTLPAQLALNAEVTLTLPDTLGLAATEGELVLTTQGTGLPSDVTTTTLAYVAWGTTFTSQAPGGVGLLSWEDRAVLDTFWTVDDRIDVGATQNTFVCGGNTGNASNGDTSVAAGFGVCTADEF